MVTLAYCLMTNHVDLVSVPSQPDTLAQVMNPVVLRYAQHINWDQGISGRLWQGRFFSCPLDEKHLWRQYDMLNAARFGPGW
ncbi:MAG: transposase [Acidobacteriia bacterium]|nr:transposase [Terriglobia bacterium]